MTASPTYFHSHMRNSDIQLAVPQKIVSVYSQEQEFLFGKDGWRDFILGAAGTVTKCNLLLLLQLVIRPPQV